jgi:hypothetical protein
MINCQTCHYWRADDHDPRQSVRGYCGNARSEKSGERTQANDSCRSWTISQSTNQPNHKEVTNHEKTVHKQPR